MCASQQAGQLVSHLACSNTHTSTQTEQDTHAHIHTSTQTDTQHTRTHTHKHTNRTRHTCTHRHIHTHTLMHIHSCILLAHVCMNAMKQCLCPTWLYLQRMFNFFTGHYMQPQKVCHRRKCAAPSKNAQLALFHLCWNSSPAPMRSSFFIAQTTCTSKTRCIHPSLPKQINASNLPFTQDSPSHRTS